MVIYSFVMFYLYLILIYIMYVSYCYVSYKCCTAIQETRIPSEMCAGETCITDGKHASLVICVWGNTHPQGYVCGKHFTHGNTHPYDTGKIVTVAGDGKISTKNYIATLWVQSGIVMDDSPRGCLSVAQCHHKVPTF